MAINLQKGQREAINAPKFTIGLGWDTNSSSTGSAFDLDASVFILGDNKRIVSEEHFVFTTTSFRRMVPLNIRAITLPGPEMATMSRLKLTYLKLTPGLAKFVL